MTGHYSSRVSPFGYLRIKAYLQLPVAYRSLSRPSSAISAMASTLRSYSLDLAKPPSGHPKTIEWPNESTFFPLLFFSDSSCAVFKVRLKFPPSHRTLRVSQRSFRSFGLVKPQNDTETIQNPHSDSLFRLSPALCRSSSGFASFLKPSHLPIFAPISLRSTVPTLEVRSSLSNSFSP